MSASSTELVRRWRLRQYQILKALPPDLLAEYHQLEALITVVEAKETGTTIRILKEGLLAAFADAPSNSPQPQQEIPPVGPYYAAGYKSLCDGCHREFSPQAPRIPMSVHKQRLIKFLGEYGQATRGTVTARTGIPEGSLSELLSGPEFVQVQHGVWALSKAWALKRKMGTTVQGEVVIRPTRKEKAEGESGG